MKNKNMMITLGITFFLFAFVSFLVYLIYCYAYYDEYQEETFANEFNRGSYDYVYDNFYENSKIDKEDYYNVIKLMYDKNTLKNIYYLYYKDSVFSNLDEFINEYYFGNHDVLVSDILFASKGKTGLFNRKEIFYGTIKVQSDNGLKSSLGLKEKIVLNIEDNTSIKIDEKELECVSNKCMIETIFGGLHQIKYISNGHIYYGLINITSSDTEIDVTNNKSLIKIDGLDVVDDELPVSNTEYQLNTGKYKLDECFLSSSCPTKKKTYIKLNEDKTCTFYTYISLSKAGDTYVGTYEIVGNFLVMKFTEHTYSVFDYDTKQTTDIIGAVNMEIRYKIENDNVIRNDSYRFKYSE